MLSNKKGWTTEQILKIQENTTWKRNLDEVIVYGVSVTLPTPDIDIVNVILNDNGTLTFSIDDTTIDASTIKIKADIDITLNQLNAIIENNNPTLDGLFKNVYVILARTLHMAFKIRDL